MAGELKNPGIISCSFILKFVLFSHWPNSKTMLSLVDPFRDNPKLIKLLIYAKINP